MKLNFKKGNGLIPAIVQDANTGKVLMLGYMSEASLRKTRDSGLVTFYSRSRQKLWTKGETSGNFLHVKEILPDCDGDTLLIKATPDGPVCHTGKDTCFFEENKPSIDFLNQLEAIIESRKKEMPEGSYTTHLFKKGVKKMAQKVGEEATEVVIDAVTDNKERLLEETADLMYHLLVLLKAHDLSLSDVARVLEKRHT
ncbi:MAG: bifunctional phosphoribosyl-AMP cyclohydrolase/phosphoribosyl-ATP diphosphatase HisIE [Caldisericaceae bacterium]|nr:bifunctional phosphoribosyl-AMP cyclohydrolase/phosphoribosyl-ATP diphosphatase HisIE [Caldisericaceae bacterium]